MNLFILTGAGLSAESGLAPFRRSEDALWERFDPYELATPEAFARDPEQVHAFYNFRRVAVLAAEPNLAHQALAMLGRQLRGRGDTLFLCTQNVDDLHERAGSADVIHMHGQLREMRCVACGTVSPAPERVDLHTACPACHAVGELRPNVVWFGEVPFHLDAIGQALRRADLFVSIGTSGSVYPAAGFSAAARAAGIPTAEINLEPSDNHRTFDRTLYGPATQTVPGWVASLLALAPADAVFRSRLLETFSNGPA